MGAAAWAKSSIMQWLRTRYHRELLHEKPDIAQDKLTWLQRSDADCGNRYGVLPLCVGMPVQAREHLHRKDFKILKGCHGTICGWSSIETETAAADGVVIWNKLPDYVFVRFETRTRWTIPGIDQRERLPGQHAKCTVVSRRRPCQPHN